MEYLRSITPLDGLVNPLFNVIYQPLNTTSNTVAEVSADQEAREQGNDSAHNQIHYRYLPEIVVLLVVGLILGWYRHILTRRRAQQRDAEILQRELNKAVSDFDDVVDKWLAIVAERKTIRFWAILKESIKEIEPVYISVYMLLDADAQNRFNAEWEDYKNIPPDKFEPQPVRLPTGSVGYSYHEAKEALSKPLKAMKQIAHTLQEHED